MSETDLMDAVVREAHFAHHRRLIDFATILAVTGAVGDGEAARAVEADAKASLSMGVPVDVGRYAAAVDLATHPLTARAAVEWHAWSLHEIDETPIDEARRIAAEASSAAPARPEAVGVIGSTPRSRRRRRAAMSAGVARVPWISIVAVILALGFLSSTGWSLYMTAREAEERANAASEYERGRADLEREQAGRAMTLLETAERMRHEAEQKEAEIKEMWNFASDELNVMLDELGAALEEGHIAGAWERLLGLEKIILRWSEDDPPLADHLAQTRVDEVIVPSLALMYEHAGEGTQAVLDEIRQSLYKLEAMRRLEHERERLP